MKFDYRERFVGLSQYRPPLNFELVGEKLDVKLDSFGHCSFEFQNRKTLFMSLGDICQKNYYEVLKIDDQVYFLHFEVEGQTPRKCISGVYDAEIGQLTLILACQINRRRYRKNNAGSVFWSGTKIRWNISLWKSQLYGRSDCHRIGFYLHQRLYIPSYIS